MESNKLEAIVFEGGGMRGLSYVGVAKALEELGILKDVDTFVGSSAGSIFAGLLVCGANSQFLEKTIKSTNFTNFCDGWGSYVGMSYRFGYKMGMYNGDYFFNWYSQILKELTGNSGITLKEIYTKYNKEIVLTATDLNNRKTCYLTKDTFPDLPLALAVRMSMSIPFFFVPVNYAGKYWVDGGYLDNYAFDYLDTYFPNKNAIGFKLIGLNDDKENVIDGWNSLMTNLIECSVTKIENLLTREEDEDRTININTFNINTTQFDIKLDDIQKLIDSGYSEVKKSF